MQWVGKISGRVVKTVSEAPRRATDAVVQMKTDIVSGYREVVPAKNQVPHDSWGAMSEPLDERTLS